VRSRSAARHVGGIISDHFIAWCSRQRDLVTPQADDGLPATDAAPQVAEVDVARVVQQTRKRVGGRPPRALLSRVRACRGRVEEVIISTSRLLDSAARAQRRRRMVQRERRQQRWSGTATVAASGTATATATAGAARSEGAWAGATSGTANEGRGACRGDPARPREATLGIRRGPSLVGRGRQAGGRRSSREGESAWRRVEESRRSSSSCRRATTSTAARARDGADPVKGPSWTWPSRATGRRRPGKESEAHAARAPDAGRVTRRSAGAGTGQRGERNKRQWSQCVNVRLFQAEHSRTGRTRGARETRLPSTKLLSIVITSMRKRRRRANALVSTQPRITSKAPRPEPSRPHARPADGRGGRGRRHGERGRPGLTS